MVDDPFCDYCGELDTLEHSLYYCSDVQTFLRGVEREMNLLLPIESRVTLSVIDVVFGCLKRSGIVNLIMLVAKQLVLQQRYRDGAMTVIMFRQHLLKTFNIEKMNAYRRSKVDEFRKKWRPFISEDDRLLFGERGER